MKVLIVGSGGREHAIAWKVQSSPRVSKLYCAPGNAGTAAFAENVPIGVTEIEKLTKWAEDERIDLTIVGPEEPLARGIVNSFEAVGLRIFGPTKEAAQLEASKSFAKEVMLAGGVSTPRGKVFRDHGEAKRYVEEQGAPIVIKADGLAAGKGVVVAQTLEEALGALEAFMLRDKFGAAGQTVVVEECINGKEASVIALVDGFTVKPLAISQDYKRLCDSDQGPNTGGMGAISPSFILDESELPRLVEEVFLPVVTELQKRGIRFRGFLYAGMIVDGSGVAKVLEFNCRLGDPETEVLLLRLESDLIDVVDAAISGTLDRAELRWTEDAAVCVVVASRGYPETVDDKKIISGIQSPESDRIVFHAGTYLDGSDVRSKGGRILTVSALGKTIDLARERAYESVRSIKFDGMQYRSDIGVRR